MDFKGLTDPVVFHNEPQKKGFFQKLRPPSTNFMNKAGMVFRPQSFLVGALTVFLLFAVGIGVYLSQKPTQLIPHAQESGSNYVLNLSSFSGSSIPVGVTSFTWNKASEEHHVTIKVDDHASEFNNACDGNNQAGDACVTNYASGEYSFSFLKDHNYTVQVFQHDVTGNQLGVISVNFMVQAPGPFTLNQPTTFCSGTNSHIRLSWTEPTNGPKPGLNSGYFIYINGEYKYNNLHALTLDDPAIKTPGQTYKYKIEAVNLPDGRTFSNEVSVAAASCDSSCTPEPTQTQTADCPQGQVGTGIVMQRTSHCPGPLWTVWQEVSRSCNAPSQSPSSSPSPSPQAKGDGNKDGFIDLGDLSMMYTKWSPAIDITSNFELDFNDDKRINSIDREELRQLLLANGTIRQ